LDSISILLIKILCFKEKKEKTKIINNVLMIYSKQHYLPNSNNKNNYLYTGTYSWSKFIYTYLRQKFKKINYIDLNDSIRNYNNKISYDLIIGIASWNFIYAKIKNPRAHCIYIAVNSNPLYRNSKIIKEANFFKVKLTNECVNALLPLLCFQISDLVILTGNNFTKKTYNKYLKDKKIFAVSGGLLNNIYKSDFSKRSNKIIKIIYPTSYLGLRKGILRFLDILLKLEFLINIDEIEVAITGKLATEIKDIFYEKINLLKKIKVTHYDWISHESLVSLLQSSDIVVSYSIEEGQPHGILEAICTGCIPFVSYDCGINLDEKFINDYNIEKDTSKLYSIIEYCKVDLRYAGSLDFIKIINNSNKWSNVKKVLDQYLENKYV
jgi:hypothetical protein